MLVRYWWNRWLSYINDWASWVITYDDGERSIPLRRGDAETRALLFGGVSVDYARNENGDLVRSHDA